MAENDAGTYRKDTVKGRVQMQNPVTGHWVKLDLNTGRIIDQKKSPGPYKGIAVTQSSGKK